MMTLEELIELDSAARRRIPNVFQLAEADRPATEEDIATLESSLNVRLPHSYKQYLRHFGGGYHGLARMYSADSDSDHYLLRGSESFHGILPAELLPVSPDGCGGCYCSRIVHGVAQEGILYWHFEDDEMVEVYENVLQLVAERGLKNR